MHTPHSTSESRQDGHLVQLKLPLSIAAQVLQIPELTLASQLNLILGLPMKDM